MSLSPSGRMNIDRNSIRSRLRHWGEWVQEPRHDVARTTSHSGTILEQKNATGSRGTGIAYDTIYVDGEAVQCRPDGGMFSAIERRGRVIAHNTRCKETGEAVSMLPAEQRRAIVDTYVVKGMGKPRSAAEVARRLQKSESTIRESLEAAYDRLSRTIYGVFEIVVSDAEELDEAA